MKVKNLLSRHNMLWVIILCYLLPLVALIAYANLVNNSSSDWSLLSIGLLLTFVGTLFMFWSMTSWEASFSVNPIIPKEDSTESNQNLSPIDLEEYRLTKMSLEEAQQMQVRLLTEIDTLTEELKSNKMECTHAKQSSERNAHDAEEIKVFFEKQLEQQQMHIRNLQEAIAEQTAMTEKKQQQVSLLESKVGDLTYEIKTLLQFAEAHSGSLLAEEPSEPDPKAVSHESPRNNTNINTAPTPPIQSVIEGSHLLKRCLDISQKITGSQRFGSQLYSFVESPAENFTLDLRRLCDRLRSDTPLSPNSILLYSPKENQLLFASNQIRDLTGWSPEKFIQTFNEVLQDESLWKQGVNSLSMRSEAKIQLPIKLRSGQQSTFQAHLGMIPTGIFRNHVIAILCSSASTL